MRFTYEIALRNSAYPDNTAIVTLELETPDRMVAEVLAAGDVRVELSPDPEAVRRLILGIVASGNIEKIKLVTPEKVGPK